MAVECLVLIQLAAALKSDALMYVYMYCAISVYRVFCAHIQGALGSGNEILHCGMFCAHIQGALGSGNEILRCAAGEALGRIVQVVGENKFIADMAQYSFDRFISIIELVKTKLFSVVLFWPQILH